MSDKNPIIKEGDYFYDWQGYYPDDGSLDDGIVQPSAPAPAYVNAPVRFFYKCPKCKKKHKHDKGKKLKRINAPAGHLINSDEYEKLNVKFKVNLGCPTCGYNWPMEYDKLVGGGQRWHVLNTTIKETSLEDNEGYYIYENSGVIPGKESYSIAYEIYPTIGNETPITLDKVYINNMFDPTSWDQVLLAIEEDKRKGPRQSIEYGASFGFSEAEAPEYDPTNAPVWLVYNDGQRHLVDMETGEKPEKLEKTEFDVPSALPENFSKTKEGRGPRKPRQFAETAQSVQGNDGKTYLIVSRGMSDKEYKAWQSGETITQGKYFTSLPRTFYVDASLLRQTDEHTYTFVANGVLEGDYIKPISGFETLQPGTFQQPKITNVQENKTKFSKEQAEKIGNSLDVDWDKIDLEQFRIGLEVESEHGKWPELDVVKDNLQTLGKIVLAHLKEFPNYYEKLIPMEKELKKKASDPDKFSEVDLINDPYSGQPLLDKDMPNPMAPAIVQINKKRKPERTPKIIEPVVADVKTSEIDISEQNSDEQTV